MNFCLYHEHCYDGMAAAWAVWKAHPDWTFVPVNYGQDAPDLAALAALANETVEIVAIVDFAYKPEPLAELCDLADKVIVLDHHKTSKEDLETFQHPNATVVFDMDRSGAGITWDHFFPHHPRPKIIDYVEDRDLWRWALHRTREVNAWLRTHPLGLMHVFDQVAIQLETLPGLAAAIDAGDFILRHQTKMVEIAVLATKHMTIGGHEGVPVVNSCLYQSEIGSELAAGAPFAVVWYLDYEGKVRHSFRSTDAGVDVGALCREFGGGGHRNAAGLISTVEDSPVLGPKIQALADSLADPNAIAAALADLAEEQAEDEEDRKAGVNK